jgi:hypothetical protein
VPRRHHQRQPGPGLDHSGGDHARSGAHLGHARRLRSRLADPRRIRALLTGAGFGGIGIEALDEPRWIGADVNDVIGYYTGMPLARSMLAAADEQTTAVTMQALREALRPYQRPGGVLLGSAAWLVTARR